MKKLINKPEDVVREEMMGIAVAHADLVKVSLDPYYVARIDAPIKGKVGIVSGTGSGHEPVDYGFVGPGMLDAACDGEVFTCQTPEQVLACDRLANGVVEAAKKVGINVPVVIRMEGTNVEQGREILEKSGLNLITAKDVSDAAQKIAAVAKG